MFVLREILRPISQRLGTALGTTLAALGVAESDISIVVAAVPVVLGISLDLVSRRLW